MALEHEERKKLDYWIRGLKTGKGYASTTYLHPIYTKGPKQQSWHQLSATRLLAFATPLCQTMPINSWSLPPWLTVTHTRGLLSTVFRLLNHRICDIHECLANMCLKQSSQCSTGRLKRNIWKHNVKELCPYTVSGGGASSLQAPFVTCLTSSNAD
ncbi:hypothetical protein DAPPUDRAFT_105454 [Daphnia pulex]|uniref:Uncharacterized protein n=1 Tax=Daphnia pulex TaxID=6669 RepID=E9GQV7_DAPPU|nr:hypothetical protein DAPPUDRAFT_105454 [Daphnia pulex]|eukprot:EFX78179.1 hypothetical protein DAPPUDRAFT_105454 [Daphnia pulex]